MRVYLENDVVFFQNYSKPTYWLEVEVFEHAESNIDMLYDLPMKKWYDKGVIEQIIHCLMEARPHKDWAYLKEQMTIQLEEELK